MDGDVISKGVTGAEKAHAWAEVYFDGVGWQAAELIVDSTECGQSLQRDGEHTRIQRSRGSVPQICI